jgi:CBS domain-containing protein
MADPSPDAAAFVALAAELTPFVLLPPEALAAAAEDVRRRDLRDGEIVFGAGDRVEGLYLIASGAVEILSPRGERVSQLGGGEVFGERGLLRNGIAPNGAVARGDTALYMLHRTTFKRLMTEHRDFATFFDRARPALGTDAAPAPSRLIATRVADLMGRDPLTVDADASVREAARLMRDNDVSCLAVTQGGRLVGILTGGDLADRVIAEALGPETPVSVAMTANPRTLDPSALGFDALLLMTEKGFDHLPVVEFGQIVGMLTSTDLVRREAVSAAFLVADIAKKSRFEDFAEITARIPKLLAQLVGAGVAPYDVGRIVTGVSDALTRRLLHLAEKRLGPAPVSWLWAACGSQGRREQTGVSDQDNCLILDDAYDEAEHGEYFREMAKFVSDGLDAAGYFYCPGDMMATADRWRQPVHVWRQYFMKWILTPNPEAQMLASVMFDLRAVAGTDSLFEGLQEETLKAARANSIFRAHMVSNSLKHQPPLGLFRGFALIRSGEHKDRIDLKHNGVVPIVDLGRVYALMGGLTEANTRDRLEAARAAHVVSESGVKDLLDAFDLISRVRLEHQARLIREGLKPDNFMAPALLSELERNHLKDAFVVVKTMQSAAAHSHGMAG